jgi:hypothetical protein
MGMQESIFTNSVRKLQSLGTWHAMDMMERADKSGDRCRPRHHGRTAARAERTGAMKKRWPKLHLRLPAAALLMATCCASVEAEAQEGSGSFWFFKTIPRVELSLTRHRAEMDTITLPPGTVVTAEDGGGWARVYWMGEFFRLSWSDLQGLAPGQPKPAPDPASQEPAPLEPVTLNVGGETYEQVRLQKEYPQSLFIQHRDGSCFVKKADLELSAFRSLGLEPPKEPANQLPEPSVVEAGLVRVATADKWEITPARMVAYLERNPIDSQPQRRLKGVADCVSIFSEPAKFADWPIEEAVWYQQSRYKKKMAPWCVKEQPIELLAQFYREQQEDGYWGKNHEKIYGVSLRDQARRFGLRATTSAEFASGWHALAYALRYSLAKQGVSVVISPHNLKRDELADKPPPAPPKDVKGSKRWRPVIIASPSRIPHTLSKRGIPTATGQLRCSVTLRDINLGAVLGNSWARPNYFGSEFNRKHRFSHDLILHELRKGNPVLAGMSSTSEHRMGGGYMAGQSSRFTDQTVLIVGFYVVRPGPEPTVVYEVLNTWGPEWGNQGFGWMEDTLVAWAVGVDVHL